MSSTPTDPSAFFRDMLGHWEKAANSWGGDAMKSEEFARTMHGANAATMTAQAGFQQFMERALAGANLPSRADFEDLSARLARIEEAVHRIEAALGGAASSADKPRPSRGRQPPAPAAGS